MRKDKKIFPDAEDFAERAKRYFKDCDSSVMLSPSCEKCAEKERGACLDCRKKKTRPYTLSGLCLYLGISKRKFNLLKNDKTFCDAVEMAMLKIETYIEENCMCGNFNGTFALAMLKEYFGFGKDSDEEHDINITLSGEVKKLSK